MLGQTITDRTQEEKEDAPAENSRYRRARPGAPLNGRTLPGMPLDFEGSEDDGAPRSRPSGAAKRRRWLRPRTLWGRALLITSALILLAAAFAAVYAGKTFLSRDSRFRIAGAGNIEAVGMSEVGRADLLQLFGEDIGRNIFFVPLEQRRRQIEQIPWVEHATVMRLLPDHIRVEVIERKPAAFVRNGGQIELIDGQGVLLTMPPAAIAQHHYSFPVVTGLNLTADAAERKARMAVYCRMIAELDSAPRRNSDQVSEVDLSAPDNLRILMTEQGRDITADLGEDRFLERFLRYKQYIGAWKKLYPQLSAVDLRYDDRVYLKMQKEAPAQPTAGGGDGTEQDVDSNMIFAKVLAHPAPATADKSVKPDAKAGKAEVKPEAQHAAAAPEAAKAGAHAPSPKFRAESPASHAAQTKAAGNKDAGKKRESGKAAGKEKSKNEKSKSPARKATHAAKSPKPVKKATPAAKSHAAAAKAPAKRAASSNRKIRSSRPASYEQGQ